MCGITGIYSLSGDPISAGLLHSMTALVRHRGPDDVGTWICQSDGIGLGNRRLAIIERGPPGAQPMGNQDSTIQLTFNGEIFNHSGLRVELQAAGHAFRSHSDAEVIIHAFEEWDTDCFTRFRGMWALALWDGRRKRLLLSRDRLGIKPLYYLEHERQIRFASEVKALFAMPGPSRELDLGALALCLTFLATPSPRTLFRGAKKLPPG